MAEKEINKICHTIRERWNVQHIAFYHRYLVYDVIKHEFFILELARVVLHEFFYTYLYYSRLGSVPVGEASVVIAISSEHRKESLEAVSFGIDALKKSVPIWKKELYNDESGDWKANKECLWTSK